ncbi:MAG: Asp-tRNA(Asn)/Glu-tRNA(Gln) amidotransferase subunit GatA [bacterium]
MKNYNRLTIKEAADQLAKGEITSAILTQSVIDHTKDIEPNIGAYITLCEEKAMEMAANSDKKRQKDEKNSQIEGIPLAIKDLFLTKGVRTTAASKILEDFVPIYESSVTRRLWDRGGVLVGKTNLDQFAMGSSTETSAYNTATKFDSTTRNPWDLDRIPGGSSGGSAAAVAADECIAAIGTDTGGSIRQPASHCGIVGLKPTYGRVSRLGTIAMASSLDQAGPMTKTVEDAAILLGAMSGHDDADATSSKVEVPDYTKFLTGDIRGMKIGVPKEFFGEGIDADVETTIRNAINELEKAGASIVEVSLPSVHYALAVYYILMPAEVSSNLARYDGIRYGLSMLKDKDFAGSIAEVYEQSRAKGFGAEAKRRIMLGSYVLSAGYYDAYYKKAQRVRTLIKNEFDQVFKNVDILATPVSPTPAFKLGEKSEDPLSMYKSDIMTVPINPAGVPAMSVPAGFVVREGKDLPVGLQLVGPMWGEDKILNVGYTYQSRTEWHNRKPIINL